MPRKPLKSKSDLQTERPTSGPSPRGGSPLLDDRTNERIERRRGWIDSRATSWRTCRPSFAGRTWRNPPSSLCKRNSRPSSGWGCRRRKTSFGNRCAHESESESSASLARRVALKFFPVKRDAGGTRRIDRYVGGVRRFVFVVSHPSSSRSDDAVVALIRDENQFLPFEPCASFPYTECSCELCGIRSSRQPNPGGTTGAGKTYGGTETRTED